MLRGFAATRAVPMGPEHAYGGSQSVSDRRSSVQRRLDVSRSQNAAHPNAAASSVCRVFLGFLLILLVLGVLPASFVFWACVIVLAFTCLRLRLQAQTLQHALEQGGLARADSSGTLNLMELDSALGRGGPVVRLIPGGGGLVLLHAEPRAALEQINLRLQQLDEEMGLADYTAFAQHAFPAVAFSPGGSAPASVSDADIAALPCHPYKPPRGTAAPASGNPVVIVPTTSGPLTRTSTTPAVLPADSAENVAEARSALPPGAHTVHPPAFRTISMSSGGGAAPAVQPHAAPPAQGPLAPWPVAVPTPGGSTTVGTGTVAPGRPRGSVAGGDSDQCRSPGKPEQPVMCPKEEAARQHELVCPVCLDVVVEGAVVMTLPCLHQFHASCVTPWLRQQGLHASCPMCKTPVFR